MFPDQTKSIEFWERKLTEKEYQSLLIALENTALVSVTNVQGFITYANKKFVEVSKYSLQELLGQNHRILKSGHQPQDMFLDLWKTISHGHVWRGEIKNRAKDGSFYWVDTSIAPILSSSGKPVQYISIRFLITDKKKLEQETLEEKVRNEALLTSIGEGVIAVDKDTNIMLINPAAEAMLELDTSEVIGKNFFDVISITDEHGNFVPTSKRPLYVSFSSGQMITVTEYYKKRRGGGTFPAAITIRPVIIHDTTIGAIALFRDITVEKQAEKAKDEFISLASHQLRTPLTSIRWVAERLETKESLTPAGQDYLKDMQRSILQLGTLIEQLLDISRFETGQFGTEASPVEVIKFIHEYIEECLPLIENKKLQLNFNTHPLTLTIVIEPTAIRNIVQSIISNAIEYTPTGGVIDITVVDNTANFLIRVDDTGIGIPREEQTKIFEKFARASNASVAKSDGSGLGLHIAKRATELCGGKIWCESRAVLGTSFFVELPVTNPT